MDDLLTPHPITTLTYPEQGGLVGGAWIDKHCRALLMAHLKPTDFVGPDRALIEALASLKGGAFNYLAIEAQLNDAGRERLAAINQALLGVPDHQQYAGWLKRVKDDSALRSLYGSLDGLKARIQPGADPEELISDTVKHLISVQSEASRAGLTDIGAAADKALAVVAQLKAGNKYPNSVSTGIAGLDRNLGGLMRGHVCILGARPSMGKTQLALQIARNVALKSKAENRDSVIVIFSAEMTDETLALRLAQCASGISLEWLREGLRGNGEETTAADFVTFTDALVAMKTLASRFKIDTTPNPTTAQMLYRVSAESALHKDGVDLVVFDYIELAGDSAGKNDNETNRVGQIMRGLKIVAKSHNCAVLALSQLSRKLEDRADRRPDLSDLRQSGDLEALAQQAIMIYRPEFYRSKEGKYGGYPTAELQKQAKTISEKGGNCALLIPKNRDGGARIGVIVQFDGEITRFSEVEDVQRINKDESDKPASQPANGKRPAEDIDIPERRVYGQGD